VGTRPTFRKPYQISALAEAIRSTIAGRTADGA